MSKNKVMRAVPIFVGVLLCMALMQTAFAARYSPNLNAATDNPMVWNSPNLNAATDNPMVWNSPNLKVATDNPMVWNSPDLEVAKIINGMEFTEFERSYRYSGREHNYRDYRNMD